MLFPKPIERTREGDFRLRLSDGERELLGRLPVELLELLASDPGDPALRRLRPTAYEEDTEAEDEYRRLMDSRAPGGPVARLSARWPRPPSATG